MYLECVFVGDVSVPHAEEQQGRRGEEHVVQLDAALREQLLAAEGVAATHHTQKEQGGGEESVSGG